MGFSVPPSGDQIRVLKYPCDCSSRPWSLFIIFYVILIIATATLPFILARVINISTRPEHQLRTYNETTIWGDLSESDIATAALRPYYTNSASLLLFLGDDLENLTLKSTGYSRHFDGSIFVARRRTIEVQQR